MGNFKKLGIITLSTGLFTGILAPGAGAAPLVNEQNNSVKIKIAQTESVVTKNDLIKKFKEFFPQFHFLTDNDFNMGAGHRFQGDDITRYDLTFQKKVNGKQIYGNIGFIGEKLEIENYYYQPANSADALFPAKLTKEKAQEAALAFLKKFPEGGEYQLAPNLYDYYSGNQILTEPISYSFSFGRNNNKVPISDQQINITVLGNGEISQFYRSSPLNNESTTFDSLTKVLPKNDVIAKIKENLSIDLHYRIDFDYLTNERNVNLVYQPSSEVFGVHALSGEWHTSNRFSPELPKAKEIKLISPQPMQPKNNNISLEEAKKLAEQLLKIDSNEVKLRIDSIEETKNYNDQDIISIHYMYEHRNGGTGTNLEIDKLTGEIISYNDIKSSVLKEINANQKANQTLSSEEALEQAIKYLKQYSPSYLHNYAMPTEETFYDEDREMFYFNFPRVVNNILVSGDQISVSVASDGSLQNLSVNQVNIKNWPSVERIISKETAAATYFENLNVNLNYVKVGSNKENNHYQLVYTPVYNENLTSFLNANTGKWDSLAELRSNRHILHPWAEKELNHLIDAGIIAVKEGITFNADASVTKGAAIEVIMKSLYRIYPGYFSGQRNKVQSFKNINPDHALYQVIERAVAQGTLKNEIENFELDKRLTREELAVWYIRTLGLEQAAKNQGIYQLSFADAKDIKAENIGFVALAHSLGLLTTSNNKFNPKQEVTYADLAVSTVRLAHEVYEKGIQINF